MTIDIRAEAASYYDLNPNAPNDVPFYKGKIPSPAAQVLELGCGTGRVLLPLAESCSYIHGIDLSDAMLAICQTKLQQAGIPSSKAKVEVGDITNFDLGRRFDLIIAPYRVLQNLETTTQVDGLFRCVRKHLSPAGTCILNVFKPNRAPEALRREWCTEEESFAWETFVEGTRISCHDRRPRMDPDNLVLYPELIYRRYEGEVLTGEAVLKIAMQCYYPEEFDKIILGHGFRIVDRWGGYEGEPYGEGPELVVQFTHGT
jgi:SAM-dependent methyltransferase